MYSRRICDKCGLTCFAETEEKLESMIKRYHCGCDGEAKDKPLPEYVGMRKLRSSNNVRLVIEDYESNS